jgi:hypothetical protein
VGGGPCRGDDSSGRQGEYAGVKLRPNSNHDQTQFREHNQKELRLIFLKYNYMLAL